MLILSPIESARRRPASLSRRKDANSQHIGRVILASFKSIKKEGC